jgi:hypothetical protein
MHGFAVPNTAYAKVGGGIPTSALVAQGINYLTERSRRTT